METEFAPGVAWLEPFYEEVKDLIPKRKIIHTVKGYSTKIGQIPTLGATHTNRLEKEYDITLKAWTIYYDGRRSPYLAYYMLEVFAHELAHVKHWDHNAAHMRLTSRILTRFAAYAKRKGLNLEAKTCKKLGKLY